MRDLAFPQIPFLLTLGRYSKPLAAESGPVIGPLVSSWDFCVFGMKVLEECQHVLAKWRKPARRERE